MILRTPTAILVAAILGAAPACSQATHFARPIRTDLTMSILIERISGVDPVDSAEIACATPDGYVAGLKVIEADSGRWGMSVFGDDALTEEVDGFRSGEPLSFLYWDPVTNWERPIEISVVEGGDPVYHANGILILDVTVNVRDEGRHLPNAFALSPPYPNPFNSGTNLTVTVDKRETFSLTVYDLVGRAIKRIYSGQLTPGRHGFVLDGAGLSAGGYRIVLRSKGRVASAAAVLTK